MSGFFKYTGASFRGGVAERLEITTNASLLSKNKAESILHLAKKHPETLLYMRYSIYSVIQEKNEKITGSNVPVETIRSNIEYFQKLRDNLQLKNVSTYAKTLKTYNNYEDNAFFSAYKNIVDQAELEMPMQWSNFERRNLLSDVYTENDINQVYFETPKMPRVCAYPFHTMAVQSDGNVVICCVDWTRHTFIGNANEMSLYEIWNGKRLKDIRNIMLSGQRDKIVSCQNCHRLPAQEYDNLDSLINTQYEA